MLKLAIICGGPSQERGISLNSARSFLDHIFPLNIDLVVLYVDTKERYHRLTPGQLYSNTPSDFDFKLAQTSVLLEAEELLQTLKEVDLIFPLIHGSYGEDGRLQAFLEANGLPFVGASSAVCQLVFNKFTAREHLKKLGYNTFPCLRITSKEQEIDSFWEKEGLAKAIVKPTQSGSSIGVRFADSLKSTKEAVQELWKKGFYELVVEPYCEFSEFTVCVVENEAGDAVSLLPIEIDIGKRQGSILDYRRKYLPSDSVRYYCPPRFSDEVVSNIRKEAEALFQAFQLRDFARIDGWVSESGEIYFSDFNPISGMEQNSFIFQQAARVGLSHTDLIEQVLKRALSRLNKPMALRKPVEVVEKKKAVFVLMGGTSSERQVSMMSGSNVWLKLLHDAKHYPVPYLLVDEKNVWQLPYAFTLHHTVEEAEERCLEACEITKRIHSWVEKIRHALGYVESHEIELPSKMSLDELIEKADREEAFVFIALHGGVGEDGTLQKKLESKAISFNGSKSSASQLCMDKFLTALAVEALEDPFIFSMPQVSFDSGELFEKTEEEILAVWQEAKSSFKTEDIIVKPQCDGCSTGVVRLRSENDFKQYVLALKEGRAILEIDEAAKTESIDKKMLVHMPTQKKGAFLLEPFIQTDKVHIQDQKLEHLSVSGWCEMTIGVLEREGKYYALHPSLSVAESHVLSVEEKFQGGTGVNITPPPESILSSSACKKVQESIQKVAQALGINNYARIDIFVECKTGVIRVIEANSLPALTPSTVIYHQALSEPFCMAPRVFLSHLVENAKRSQEMQLANN